jgi:hypothetical protein
MRVSLRLALGLCLVGTLFTIGIASGWAASHDTVSTETTTTNTAESATTTEVTTTTTEATATTTEATATTPTSATITVTTTINPTGAAVVGAAAASNDQSETDWGWVAFGILAALVVIFGIVWFVLRRRPGMAT